MLGSGARRGAGGRREISLRNGQHDREGCRALHRQGTSLYMESMRRESFQAPGQEG